MRIFDMLFFNITVLALLSIVTASVPSLTVRTNTGIYTGLQNPQYNDVREFRNIPYAESPVGKRRWLPPEPLRPSRQHHYASRYPPSCPQYMPGTLSLWNTNISDFMINTDGQSHTSGLIAQTTSEDCLSLAIWTPLHISQDDRVPVAFFITGGSWIIGGVDVPYQVPAPWVSRSQKHIAVTINYRVNIMGFPNAAGLEDQNLGVLDQRLALEWVYSNIAAFGGDPDRITIWGQSAGGVAVDILNYAWHDNPLAAGLFIQSGAALRNFSRGDDEHTNFTFVAKNLGCDFPDDATAEINCMRQVPVTLILNFIGQYNDNRTTPRIGWGPLPDDKVVFSNYSARAEAGLISKLPALISNTANEESSLLVFPYKDIASGPNKTTVERATLDVFVCVTANTTDVRAQNHLTTYRYQYAGNFSNMTPWSWMGAYHSADVPMMFGTYNRRGGASDFQKQVSETMQDFFFAFISDPKDGLKLKGWLPHDGRVENGGYMIRFGSGGQVAQNVNALEADGVCIGKGSYNSAP